MRDNICPNCKKNKANFHEIYGVLPCTSCSQKQQNLISPKEQVEFTSESIKNQRKAYRSDFLPMHNRGELDKGWLDRYGEKKAKEHGFTDKEIKKAKYVWNGADQYYKEH